MPREITSLHVDQALSNFARDYRNGGFKGQRIFPIFPVLKESDKYHIFTKRDSFRSEETLKGVNSAPRIKEWSVSTDSFACEEHALRGIIPDRERNNADPAIDIEGKTVEDLTDSLLLAYEIRVAAIVTSTSNITQNTTLSGTSQWSDFTNSNPISDVRTGRVTIHKATGKNPNRAAMGREVFDKLVDHPDLLERIKYTREGITTEQLVAALFGVEELLVCEALKDSANEGQTASLTYAFGKDVLLFYADDKPSKRTVSLGWTFAAQDLLVKRKRNDDIDADMFDVGHIVDEKLVAADCGYLIKAAVA